MESRENKLIADKLNLLDTLPQGYEPNLDAKWALLEAGEEKKKKVFFLFAFNKWIGVAACLLLFMVGGLVWIYKPTQVSQTNASNTANVALPVVKPVTERIAGITPATEKVNVVVKPAVKHKTISRKKAEESMEVAVIDPPVIDTVLGKANEVATIQQPVIEVKNKKQRYIQVDFNDNILPPEKSTYAQTFKIKFGLRSVDNYPQDLQNRTAVKMKQNF